MKHKTSLLSISMLVLMCVACGKKAEPDLAADSTAAAAALAASERPAVCVYEGISLREKPSKSSKWISGISLGERLTALGLVQLDAESEIEYVKVRLLDDKEGWASAQYIIPDAKAGAIIQNSVIYKRPDLATVTDKSFEPLDLVAVYGEQGEWLKVVGKRKQGHGIERAWIHNAGISYDDADVAVSSMASKAMSYKQVSKRKEELQRITENPAISRSMMPPRSWPVTRCSRWRLSC